jgi:hypothetical protein
MPLLEALVEFRVDMEKAGCSTPEIRLESHADYLALLRYMRTESVTPEVDFVPERQREEATLLGMRVTWPPR